MSFFRSVIVVALMSTIVSAAGPRSRQLRGSKSLENSGEGDATQFQGAVDNKGFFMRHDNRRRFRGTVDNVRNVKNVENSENVENVENTGMPSRPRGFIKKDEEQEDNIMTRIHKHVHNHKAQKHQRKQQRKQFTDSLKPVTEEQVEQVQENKQGVQPPQVTARLNNENPRMET